MEKRMAESTIWWVAAGCAVALELATGTFYLLMIALGLAAAALGAHFGLGSPAQTILAALIGGGAVAGWHLGRSRGMQAEPAASNPDVHIDIGEAVQVDEWHTDGTAQVKYRGAQWTAVRAPAPASTHPAAGSAAGRYRIREMQGNRLVLEPF
jgi:membrane protein implicated in regulation of membrane protease activity